MLEKTIHVETEAKRHFFAELIHRRVPQVVGLYMAGSWTFLEFSEAIFSRLNLSPYWSDISLITVLIMFPTVMILAYRHGAPGNQSWGRVEKLGIPMNIIALISVVFMVFSEKDLGYRAEMVQTITPDGTVMEVMVPKKEFRKRIFIGPFKVRSETINPLMGLGVALAVNLDLDQDAYIHSFGPLSEPRPIKEAGFTDANIPLALMLKIARNRQLEYVVTGDVRTNQNNEYEITASIYESSEGTLIKRLSATDNISVFNAIDKLTPEIKTVLGVSDFGSSEQVNLPIEERLTSNLDAFYALVEANILTSLQNKFVESEEAYKRAIELDPSFAMASIAYSGYLLFQSRIDEGLEILKLAKRHDYRFHLSQKFYLSTIQSIYSGDFEKTKTVLSQWLAMEPEGTTVWQVKANYHASLGQRELAIEAYNKLLELEPNGANHLLSIGTLYSSMGDLDKAIEYYERFIEKEPENGSALLLLGDAYRSQGDLERSTAKYVQAQFLSSNDISADRRIAENLKRTGKFDEAEAEYLKLLAQSNTSLTKYEVLRELSKFYSETGQWLRSVDAIESGYEILDTIAPEGTVLLVKMQDAWQFARAGQSARGAALIDDAKAKIDKYDNGIFRANILIAEAMFLVVDDPTNSPIQKIDEAQQNAFKFVGDGNDHTFQMLRGIAHHFIGEYQEAANELSSFLNDYPTYDVTLWLLLASSELNMGNTAEAKKILAMLLREYPAYPGALHILGKIHVEANELESGAEVLRQALVGWSNADDGHEATADARRLLAEITKG